MKIIIEPTARTVELPDGSSGQLWEGRTDGGVPIVAVVATLVCAQRDRAAIERECAAEGNVAAVQGAVTIASSTAKMH